ncbi:MAG: 5'/3'-nucleotidase SurE [Anaerolineaceae bacterium]|nr:5'/3'-nucleotidase SurE [Anaerolineaceae bacterium]
MNTKKPQILLTNDDGIRSPGLWAAAEALSEVGYVHVTAPRDQFSGAGRSLPSTSDGRIEKQVMTVHGQQWDVYAIGGSPAQTVLHGVLDILPERPDLVVSGINYGENLGHSILSSGTVGAAFEAASIGIKALAVSLELKDITGDLTHSPDVDFSTAAFFTAKFARLLLESHMPPDVDLLKIDLPFDATPDTPWRITRQGKHRYYSPFPGTLKAFKEARYLDDRLSIRPEDVPPDSDIHALMFDRIVSATPLSLDLTSRVDLADLERSLRSHF